MTTTYDGGQSTTSSDDVHGNSGSKWVRRARIGIVAALLVVFGIVVGNSAADPLEQQEAIPGADSVEVGFAQDMSVHHLQAVSMANWARERSTDPQLRQLAFDIASGQTEQVGRMKGWLMLWDQPEQAIGPPMAWMARASDGAMSMSMAPSSAGPSLPGMATPAEMAKLRSLTGRELDVYFLQLMLRHHEGGSSMARYAKDNATSPPVLALAQSILVSQSTEMTVIGQMLSARNARPLP
ncbi:DUF305 domain-containing protein [Amycolatopsis sp. NPDC003861]